MTKVIPYPLSSQIGRMKAWLFFVAKRGIIPIFITMFGNTYRIVAKGTPEQVSEIAESYTGKYLKPMLKKREKVAAEWSAAAWDQRLIRLVFIPAKIYKGQDPKSAVINGNTPINNIGLWAESGSKKYASNRVIPTRTRTALSKNPTLCVSIISAPWSKDKIYSIKN